MLPVVPPYYVSSIELFGGHKGVIDPQQSLLLRISRELHGVCCESGLLIEPIEWLCVCALVLCCSLSLLCSRVADDSAARPALLL